MPTTNSFKLKRPSALAAAIAMALPVSVNGAVARIDFAIGQVTATDAGGTVREIKKGASLENGDTISTKRGRAQLRFTDGGFVSLKPQTDFRIDEYAFSGEADGQERAFMSLLKGGFRTLTGLIGRANKNAYKVETPIATIGIRGTGYEAVLENPLIVRVTKGRACIGVVCASPGQRIRMEKGQPPVVEVQTGQKSEEEVIPTPAEEYTYETAQECAEGSEACVPNVLVESVPIEQVPECTSCAVGVVFLEDAQMVNGGPSVTSLSHDQLDVTFPDPGASMTMSDSNGNILSSNTAQVQGASFDNVAGWFRWFGPGSTQGQIPESSGDRLLGDFTELNLPGDQSVLGYVIDPATSAELSGALSGEYVYELAGASPAIFADGSAIGSLGDARFEINFTSGYVNAFMTIMMPDEDYSLSAFYEGPPLQDPRFTLEGSASSPSSCFSSCSASVDGHVGKGLSHVGFTYHVERFQGEGKDIIGSGVSKGTPPPLGR